MFYVYLYIDLYEIYIDIYWLYIMIYNHNNTVINLSNTYLMDNQNQKHLPQEKSYSPWVMFALLDIP